MEYLEAPNYREFMPFPAIFLAGGITGCPDWQTELFALLKDLDSGIAMNPRRKAFDVSDKNASKVQIKWEFDCLWASDVIVFWFCKDTIQPIVLLEFGSRLAHYKMIDNNSDGDLYPPFPKLIIGIEDGYSREEDVIVQAELVFGTAPIISRSIKEIAERVKNLEY